MRRDNIKRKRLRFLIRIGLLSILSLTILICALWLFIHYLVTSKYFTIKYCDSSTQLDRGIEKDKYYDSFDIIGQNIFKINLQEISEVLRRRFPDYKSITLKRALPDRVIIEFQPREAIAMVELSERFFVDKEGILFRSTGQGIDSMQLPLIIGLRNKIADPRPGIRYSEGTFRRIIEFINSINKIEILSERLKIREINSKNINDIFILTVSGCKINLGSIKSLGKDLIVLQRLLHRIGDDLGEMEYIDLRFREPAVKYKKK